MFGPIVYCLSITLFIGFLWFGECYGELTRDEKALMKAVRQRQWTEMIKLAKGVNVDIEDDYHNSPLRYAIDRANAEVVEKLLTYGVKNEQDRNVFVNKPDHIGGLPIYYAVIRGEKAIFNILVKHGADPTLDHTLLDETVEGCEKEKMKELATILIDTYKFDLNGRFDSLQETPLHKTAIHNCDEEFMKIFTSRGANVNAVNTVGETPLHQAAGLGKVIAVEALLDLGAKLEAKDSNGKTPFQRAKSEKVKLLRDAAKERAKSSGKAAPV